LDDVERVLNGGDVALKLERRVFGLGVLEGARFGKEDMCERLGLRFAGEWCREKLAAP
jgi:hypothetical protein